MQKIKDLRICFVGDSFINGTGDPEKLGWTGRLCAWSEDESIQITHYNLGIRRNTSDDILQRWQNEVDRRLAENCEKLIVFSYGVNDTVIENEHQRVTTQQTLKNTRSILSQAAKQYPVKMIGPPPIDDMAQNNRIEHLDKQFKLLCSTLNIPYLSIYRPLLKAPLWLDEVAENDGAHPKIQGYTLLAKFIQSWEAWKL